MAESLWEQLPGRYKDYIAKPKPNGYQSIHMSMVLPGQSHYREHDMDDGVKDKDSSMFSPCMELQIRTRHMDDLAEAGEASHASYKGGLDSRQVRQLKEWTYLLKQQLVNRHHGKLLLPPADPKGESASPSPHARSSPSAEDVVGRAARDLFSNWDLDGNGELTLDEVQEQLRELGAGYDAEADAEALISMARDEEVGGSQRGPEAPSNGGVTSSSDAGSDDQRAARRRQGITLQEFSRFVKKVGF